MSELYQTPTRIEKDDSSESQRRGYCPRCRQLFQQEWEKCPDDDIHLLMIDPGESELIGEVIENRLTLLGLVGSGGMGTVYRAYQHSMEREVAVKLMHPCFSSDSTQVQRFLQEARSASRLAHPNIITLFDFGQTHEGQLYLVMELLRGRSLAQILKDEGPLPIERVVQIISQTCDALHAAHQEDVVHRDVKPDNIFIVNAAGFPGEFVKVIDFGLATIALRTMVEPVQEPNAINGTPAYMSPEQILGKPVDGRSDIYSLGVVLYEAISGRLPFVTSKKMTMLVSHIAEPPLDLGVIYPDASRPKEIDEVVLRALSKKPSDRPASTLALKYQLQYALGQRIRSTTSVTPIATPIAQPVVEATNIRAISSSFVGREEELEALEALITLGSRLITVHGPAGMGKTRISLRFATLNLNDTYGRGWSGIWFCDLTEARTLEDVCHAVGRVLEISISGAQSVDDIVCQLGAAITVRKSCLLILDNFEQLVSVAEPALERWLELAPELRLIVTSRVVLRLPEETVYELPPLSLPTPGAMESNSEAMALFVERAQAVRPTWDLSEADFEAVAEIVRQLDGLPLAIELAAARMSILAPIKLLGRLGKRFDLLTSSTPQMLQRRRATLRAAIEWSWELLAPYEKSAIAQLSVFAGGFSLEAAEAVVQLEEADAPWVGDILHSLREKSLLRVVEFPESSDDLRFGMLESIRNFAAEQLKTEESDSCHERHAVYYLDVCGRWSEEVECDGPREMLSLLALELENLTAIHRWSLTCEPPSRAHAEFALKAACCLDPVLTTRGPFGAHLDLLDQALVYAEGLDIPPSLLARALHARGEARRTRGRFEESSSDCKRALELARKAGDRFLEGRVLWNLGALADNAGRLEEARDLLGQALDIQRSVGDRCAEGRTHGLLGIILFWQGHLELARSELERAILILQEIGDRFEGVFLGALAAVSQEMGALNEARMQYERAIEALQAAGARRYQGMFTGYLGGLEWEQGRTLEAKRCLDTAIAIAQEVGDRRNKALFLAKMAAINACEDDLVEASLVFQRAEAIMEKLGEGAHWTVIELHRGHLDLALSRQAAQIGPHEEESSHRQAAALRVHAAEAANAENLFDGPARRSDDVRFALRMLKRALEQRGHHPKKESNRGRDAR